MILTTGRKRVGCCELKIGRVEEDNEGCTNVCKWKSCITELLNGNLVLSRSRQINFKVLLLETFEFLGGGLVALRL